jgi:thiol:disulfide interchange protein
MGETDWSVKGPVAILIVLGGLLFYRMHFGATTFAADGTDPGWDAAAQRAHEVGEPTLVLFTADWCPYCRTLESEVLPSAGVQEELRHYNFLTVQMGHPSKEDSAHASQLRVGGYPQLIRFDAEGKETGRSYFMDPRAMAAWLKEGE